MKNIITIAAAAVLILLFAGCGNDAPPSPEEPALGPFASTLEGEAMARYEDMTPRQRQGVETLAERLGAERTTEWLLADRDARLDIFPLEPDPPAEQPAPFESTLEGEALARYEQMGKEGRSDIEFYARALGREAAAQALLFLSVEGSNPRIPEDYAGPQIAKDETDPTDIASYLMSHPPEDRRFIVSAGLFPSAVFSRPAEGSEVEVRYAQGDISAPLPPLEGALTADEKAKMDAFDPRLRVRLVWEWERGVSVQDPTYSDEYEWTSPNPDDWLAFVDPAGFVADKVDDQAAELRWRITQIPAEFPPIEDLVLPEIVADYEALSEDGKDNFWNGVASIYASGVTVGGRDNPDPWPFDGVKEKLSSDVAFLKMAEESRGQNG